MPLPVDLDGPVEWSFESGLLSVPFLAGVARLSFSEVVFREPEGEGVLGSVFGFLPSPLVL